MDHNNTKVVTRFAPSPTGFMHIGGVRTALYAYLHARKNNGTFILRIEDTDKAREVAGSIEHIMESLRWLGIEWDYGPDKPGEFVSCIQSERLAIYRRYAEDLLAKGLAYPDPYTEEEVANFRAEAESRKEPFLYRNHRPIEFKSWDGKTPLRYKVPEIKRYHWEDEVRGKLSAGEEMLDDFILIKSDGYPTYNFAHIIDDHEMGVTHIMRADEFISSTPKFLSLYDGLGFTYPKFVTLPPILRDDRTKKLGKRDGAKDILDYRSEGYLPEAMMNFLALIGWNPGTDQEVFTHDELADVFDITKIQRAGAAFNEEKLQWMNKQHLNRLTPEAQAKYAQNAFKLYFTEEISSIVLEKLTSTLLERTQVATDIKEAIEAGEYDFTKSVIEYETTNLRWKNDSSVADALPRLVKVGEILENADFTSTESIKAKVWPLAEEIGKGEVLWPLRVALSGKEKSPDPFTLAYILGKQITLERIKQACDKISLNEA